MNNETWRIKRLENNIDYILKTLESINTKIKRIEEKWDIIVDHFNAEHEDLEDLYIILSKINKKLEGMQ